MCFSRQRRCCRGKAFIDPIQMVGVFFLCQQDPLFRGIFPLFRLPYLNVPHLPTQQHIRFVTGDETRIYADNDRSFLGFYTKVILDEIDVVTLLPTSVALKPASLFRRDIRKTTKEPIFLSLWNGQSP